MDAPQAQGVGTVGTVVVGGGQAGLVMAHHLVRAGDDVVVLDAGARVGDAWRSRWDSLRLFTLPRYASLPGLPIGTASFPTRDEMADYLERYAAHFALPVRSGVRVERVSRSGNRFLVATSDGSWRCDRVVVATGSYARPRVPALAAGLDPGIEQLHSLDYRSPDQLAPGPVLVVGAGNSGTDIALDAARAGHRTLLAGRHPGHPPLDIDGPLARPFFPALMFTYRHLLTLRTPVGRAYRGYAGRHGAPLGRNRPVDLDAAGIVRLGRVTGVSDGLPVTDEGVVPEVATIVWCTGSRPDHGFLDLPAAGQEHRRGVAAEPGLYFLGLEFQYALASATLQGLDRDARHLVRHMRAHADLGPARRPVPAGRS